MQDKKFLRPWEFEDGEDRDKTVVIIIASILLGLSLYWFQDEIGSDTTVLIAVIVGLVNAFTLIVNGFFQRSKKNNNEPLDVAKLIEIAKEEKKEEKKEEIKKQPIIAKPKKDEVDEDDIDIDAELKRIRDE